MGLVKTAGNKAVSNIMPGNRNPTKLKNENFGSVSFIHDLLGQGCGYSLRNVSSEIRPYVDTSTVRKTANQNISS
jgi:hypothetical protein